MWPKIRDGFVLFFTDKVYFSNQWDKWVVKVRSILMAAGASVAVYGDQIAANVAPEHVKFVKFAGVLLMAVALALRAGDKNEVKP